MIIGLAGKKLTGKGTVKDYLASEYGAVDVRMSSVLEDIMDILGKPYERDNYNALAGGLRDRFGSDVLAQALAHKVGAMKDAVIVIDGIRKPSEVDVFSVLPDFKLIYIDAPARNRYERQLERGEKVGETDMTFEQFMEREQDDTELDIAAIEERSDLSVNNIHSIEQMHAVVAEQMQNWGAAQSE